MAARFASRSRPRFFAGSLTLLALPFSANRSSADLLRFAAGTTWGANGDWNPTHTPTSADALLFDHSYYSSTPNTTGTLTFAGASSHTGSTVVNAGTLNFATGSAQTGGSPITVNAGGTLNVSGSIIGGTVLNVDGTTSTAANVTLTSGGKFATGGLSEGNPAMGSAAGIGQLTLTGGSTIDFAAGANGSALTATAGVVTGSGTISVLAGVEGLGGDSGAASNDRLLFAADPHFTASQLAMFQFYDDSNNAIGAGAVEAGFDGFTEIVPVPEPGGWLAGVATVLVGAAAWRRRESSFWRRSR